VAADHGCSSLLLYLWEGAGSPGWTAAHPARPARPAGIPPAFCPKDQLAPGISGLARLLHQPGLPEATDGQSAADALATTRAAPPPHTCLLHRPGAQEAKQAAFPALTMAPAGMAVYTNASVHPDITTATAAGLWRGGGGLGYLLLRAAPTAPEADVSGPGLGLARGPPGVLARTSASALRPVEMETRVARHTGSCSTTVTAASYTCARWGEYLESFQ
jgi:hypothetical protein